MAISIKERIEQIEKICLVEHYFLCFIGKVDVGKSTAIPNLLGLVNGENLSEFGDLKIYLY